MRFAGLVFGLMILLVGMFLVLDQFDIALLRDPTPGIRSLGFAGIALSLSLLVGDVVLPVPASLVMIANGALFGIWIGTAVSIVGGFASTVLAFWIGRRGKPFVDRIVTVRDKERSNQLLDRWGGIAIIVTRPIPILAETTALAAGTSSMSLSELTVAGFIGSIPHAIVFAVLGSESVAFESTPVILGVIVLVAGLYWARSVQLRGRIEQN